MSATKLLYVISNVTNSKGFEWTFSQLIQQNNELHVILLNADASSNSLFTFTKQLIGERCVQYKLRTKKDLPLLIWKTFRYIQRNQIEIIHSHLFEGSIVGTLAGKLAGVKKNIYTRHHSDYHHSYFPSAVKFDRLVNVLATDIVAISEGVKRILIEKEKVNSFKIELIPHGFDFIPFQNIDDLRVELIREKYNLISKSPIIGVISRFEKWKGVDYIIDAFERYLVVKPNAKLVLANASGIYKKNIEEKLKNLPLDSYVLISFESDNIALYKCFDRFVHVPIDASCEAYGQVYVEALLAEIPSIFTLSGIANDFVQHQANAWVVPYQDGRSIYHALIEMDRNPAIVEACIKNGKMVVQNEFSIEKMIQRLMQLYSQSY